MKQIINSIKTKIRNIYTEYKLIFSLSLVASLIPGILFFLFGIIFYKSQNSIIELLYLLIYLYALIGFPFFLFLFIIKFISKYFQSDILEYAIISIFIAIPFIIYFFYGDNFNFLFYPSYFFTFFFYIFFKYK